MKISVCQLSKTIHLANRRYLKKSPNYLQANSAHSPSVEIESKLISSDFALFSDFLIEIPSTSSESLFSLSDDSEPSEPRIDDFVSEFVFTTDFERVTTITTSDRGDCEWTHEIQVSFVICIYY